MRTFLLKRLPSGLLVLALASFLVFLILRLIPGDPATSLAGPDASPATVEAIRTQLGLDRPLFGQYLSWLGHLLGGDLGPSYAIGGQVADLIGNGLGATTQLALGALLLVVLIALPLAVAGATAQRRPAAAAIQAFTTAVLAIPPFVTGVVLVLVFAVSLHLLPAGGQQSLLDAPDLAVQYLAMPALCLALPSAAVLARYLKDGIERALAEDYVRTATALGVSRRRIVWRHALPNALPSAVTVLGLQIGQLIAGAVLVERIFAWPGLGQLIEQGVARRDYPVVQDLLLLVVAVYVAVQLLTDLAYAWLDPRIRWE
ncbi:peptide/nickel transport system permease protein [Streptomyces sp. 1114.5]|uniref:ABC transporter permease n=1 Tax=unclassified Streptomyces TaxID=2593676 RepID=UPI000BCCF60A|nr:MULTISPECIES: ABC transporter permease [unclassified Streptomyces]RKT19294.1 peptide/nickel transport system permease protein [Streptomyces sp. 1114.5]SOB85491.1 peptide/nickel transport system permease protein [Streptomyces sp. 1331.2]